MRKYVPRKAGKRWLEGAPDFVLDCFDEPKETAEPYTILLCGDWLVSDGTFANTHIAGFGIDDEGRSCSFELDAYHTAQFRFRHGRHRVKWESLPRVVRREVIARDKYATQMAVPA